jgi:excisionase family DNA binding protein
MDYPTPRPHYPPGTLFNKAQAARYLSVSRGTVDRLMAAGLIEYSRIGVGRGTVRFTVEALDAYLRTHTTPTREDAP